MKTNSRLRLSKIQLLSCVLFSGITVASSSSLAEIITFTSDKGKLNAKIAANKINRIELSKNPVSQIIGDESQYSVLTDEIGKNIFFVSKVPAGEKIELSLVDTTGAVVDLSMQVANIGGQVIKIGEDTYQYPHQAIGQASMARKSNREIAAMLKCMIKDEADKYYKIITKRKLASSIFGLDITQDRLYRFGDLEGARLQVINRGVREGITFTEANFKNLFEGMLLVNIDQKYLKIGKSSYVYVIAAKENSSD
ncbi:MAG: hypothetical protein EOP45_01280 [Sphingobacteriaceae bacterium]|nr:MAG: hypothetical protein EOP45_01280 [Sphingobacteriaceae bacterium]